MVQNISAVASLVLKVTTSSVLLAAGPSPSSLVLKVTMSSILLAAGPSPSGWIASSGIRFS